MLYLIAGNGSPNYGDELIVQNWLRFYRDNGYLGPILVDGRGASRSEKLLRGFGDVTFVKGIPRHADGIVTSYAEFFEMGTRFADAQFERYRLAIGIHLLGGGYASAAWNNATRLLGTAVRLGRLMDIPVIATGLGIAPFKKLGARDREAWKAIIDGCALFECRDEASHSGLLSILGKKTQTLISGLDDAFSFSVRRVRHDGRWLHLSAYSAKSLIDGARLHNLRTLADEFDRTVFWVCSKPDAELYAVLAEKFPNIYRLGNEYLLNRGLPLNKQDFMITARFHPHLQAARSGLGGYFSADSDFYRTKHQMIVDLGSTFLPVSPPLRTWNPGHTNMEESDTARVEAKQQLGCEILSLFGIRQSQDSPVVQDSL